MPTPSYLLPGSGQAYSNVIRGTSTAQQALVATTRAIVVGSEVRLPARGMKAGDRYFVRHNITKTAAGAATTTYDVATVARDAALTVGNATARISFTKPAGTAAADEGVVEIQVHVRLVSTIGILVGSFLLSHNLAATGHAQTPQVALYATSAAFDNSDLGGGYIVTCATTGASDVIVVEVSEADYVQRSTSP